MESDMKRINTHVCDSCGKGFKTEMVDIGVTPASLTCHSCNGDAWSMFFDCPQNVQPDYYWFKPTDKQLRSQVEWELDWMGAQDLISAEEAFFLQKQHVNKGGLVLAPNKESISSWNDQG